MWIMFTDGDHHSCEQYPDRSMGVDCNLFCQTLPRYIKKMTGEMSWNMLPYSTIIPFSAEFTPKQFLSLCASEGIYGMPDVSKSVNQVAYSILLHGAESFLRR
jgi:hypothetical protein